MSNVTLRELVKVYGRQVAVKGIDLEIEAGSFVAFVGPSGCGKSTTLRMIAGLESVSHGDIRIGGKRVNDVPSRDRGIAMVFQSYALYPHMTVYENMAFSLKVAKVPREEIDRRVRHAADILRGERGARPIIGRGEIRGAPFWSESPFFVNRLGVPAVYCAPGDIRNCHTFEEHVDVEEYFAGIVAFATFMARYCGVEK